MNTKTCDCPRCVTFAEPVRTRRVTLLGLATCYTFPNLASGGYVSEGRPISGPDEGLSFHPQEPSPGLCLEALSLVLLWL